MLAVARTDAIDGSSLSFIEPHGDVVHALCGLLPASERDNMVLVDLANTDYPVGINPLDMVGKDRDKSGRQPDHDRRIPVGVQLWLAHGKRARIRLEDAG